MEKEILELYDLIKNKNIEKAYVICKKLYRSNKFDVFYTHVWDLPP